MSDEATAPEILINIKGPSELKLQITITTDKTVLELKQAISQKSDVEADRQRLIYSGRVLKDEDALSVYKIQSSHTIHMVKGAARPAASSSQAPQPLPTMQAGQNPLDPLTQLNSHRGYGAMAGLNPFADMGLNPNDPNMMQTMMNSPQFLQQMSNMMQNPEVIDQIIASNPQLQGMGPQVRQAFQSEQFREIISNPERLQQMLQMASMFNGAGAGAGGGGPFGASPFGGGGGGGFPAPGTPGGASTATPSAGSAPTAAGAPFPPFNLFAPPAAGGGTAGQPPNPFGMDPAAMQQFMGGFGAPAFGGAPAAPADTRSPEERFQVQLQQLQDMGFTNASQNVRALLATGGNVHSAIEYILGGGGL
ncbi:Ubiquitin domain-containing protein DSK2 [Hypsizygus marmoreus]|uniref:Ubiquitin domain-containing protein DSK2 n=1 Tax=Hypsizygus marmoreus TaxID=39966 RepID=A0A369JQI5_HYPMA|nr:Ubiquitin domain-containing protein DSK2 [Hypsizygus marmoreus]